MDISVKTFWVFLFIFKVASIVLSFLPKIGLSFFCRRPWVFWKRAKKHPAFSKHLWFAFVVVFLAEMGRIPCCGRAESSSSNIWYEKPFWCVKLCGSHTKCVSLLALGFTHHKGFSYQIFELEDSGLPQQGILPISARKTTTKANHRCLEKDSFHCAWATLFSISCNWEYSIPQSNLNKSSFTMFFSWTRHSLVEPYNVLSDCKSVSRLLVKRILLVL